MTLHRWLASAALALLATSPCAAADFALAVTPPRFELTAQPGERLRQVIEITNAAAEPNTVLVRTAEWHFAADGTSNFVDDLDPGSCRPWVAIERHEVVVAARQSYRYRIEVAPPAGQAPTECRFAILLQGKNSVPSKSGGPSVTGRVAVIVYVGVGAVQPDLDVVGTGTRVQNGKRVPVLQVRNKGTAHGRLDGFLTMTDASGRRVDAAPANTPILPGETRAVDIIASDAAASAPAPQLPLTVRGKLEWGKDRSTEVERVIER